MAAQEATTQKKSQSKAGQNKAGQNKTAPTTADVGEFLDAIEPAGLQADAQALDKVFREVTGFEPQMWGPSIVGYGRYHYRYDSGREGDFLATGFSPRKSGPVLYIMPGYTDFGEILADLGRHTLGKSCLYLKSLSHVNNDALRRLIRAGLDDLDKRWRIEPQ